MYVCHDFIDLLCYTLFVFSTKTSTCYNYSYQKYNQETKNNSSFSKHQYLKFVCLSLQKHNKKKNKKKKKKKKTALKHLQFRKKELHMFWHVFCQNNVKPIAKHLNIFVSHKLETGQSA